MLTMAASIDVVSDSDSDLVERAASTYAGILPYCAESLPVQGEDGESRRDSGSMPLSRLIRSVVLFDVPWGTREFTPLEIRAAVACSAKEPTEAIQAAVGA